MNRFRSALSEVVNREIRNARFHLGQVNDREEDRIHEALDRAVAEIEPVVGQIIAEMKQRTTPTLREMPLEVSARLCGNGD